jgi:hypothetical protein
LKEFVTNHGLVMLSEFGLKVDIVVLNLLLDLHELLLIHSLLSHLDWFDVLLSHDNLLLEVLECLIRLKQSLLWMSKEVSLLAKVLLPWSRLCESKL